MDFCTNCGNQLNGEKFCTKCGAVVSTESAPTPIADPPNKNIVKTVIAAAVVVAIIVSAFFLFSGRSYKALVKDYVNATVKADAKKMVSVFPDELMDAVIKEEYDGDKKEMLADIEDTLEVAADEIKDKKMKVSHTIVDTEDLDKDEIDDLKDRFEDEYDLKLKIKDAKNLEVKLKATQDGDTETTKLYLTAVKIGRSWYLLDFNF